MPFRIEPELAQSRLRVTTTGALDAQEFVAMSQAVLAQARELRIKRLLVDHRAIRPAVSTLEIHEFPALFARLGVDSTYRVATIVPADSATRGNFEFFHALAANRGEHHFRQFDDEAEAIAWLAEG